MGKIKNDGVDQGSTAVEKTDIERLADAILARQNGNVPGGTPFVPLSAEEVAATPPRTMQEIAAQYFEFHTRDGNKFPWPYISVTTDGIIFLGNPQGDNARDNYVVENRVKGISFSTFTTPQ